MTRCAAETDGLRCTVMDYIRPSGLCHYHRKMATVGQYEFWSGRLLDPTRGVERVVNLVTGATIYQKGSKE